MRQLLKGENIVGPPREWRPEDPVDKNGIDAGIHEESILGFNGEGSFTVAGGRSLESESQELHIGRKDYFQ